MNLRVTPTLTVSDITPADLSAYVEHLSEKDVSDRTLRIPFPYTAADADAWIAMVAAHSEECGETTTWAIRENGFLVGGIGFDDFVPGKAEVAELGYWLAKSRWNQGIMTRAVGAICDFSAQRWKLKEIVADVLESNIGSQKVLEKNAFVLQERRPESIEKHGVLLDSRLYARQFR